MWLCGKLRTEKNQTARLPSFLAVNRKSQLWGKLFSKNFASVNAILNFKNRYTSLWNWYQTKTLFVTDVSVDWATGRRWQIKLVETNKVTQIHFNRKMLINYFVLPIVSVSNFVHLNTFSPPCHNIVQSHQLPPPVKMFLHHTDNKYEL